MFDIRKRLTFLAPALVVALAGGLMLLTNRIGRQGESRYPPAGEFVSAEAVSLHYIDAGTGAPVILIHGDGGSVQDWTKSIFDRVAQDYRSIAVDRPGFGYSERPEGAGSPFVQARLIRQAAKSLGVQKPILVGHSRGGNVALAYALAYPDHVGAVVTLSAAPYGGEIAVHNRLLSLPLVGPMLAHTVYVPFGRGAVRAGLDAAFAPESEVPSGYMEAYAAYELRPRQLLAHANDQVRGRAAAERMALQYGELRVPLIVVHGTADRNVPVEQARRLSKAVPQSELIDIPGAGHEIMFMHPDVVMDAIAAAAAAVRSSGG